MRIRLLMTTTRLWSRPCNTEVKKQQHGDVNRIKDRTGILKTNTVHTQPAVCTLLPILRQASLQLLGAASVL